MKFPINSIILESRFWLTSSDSSPVAAENMKIIYITATLKIQKITARNLFLLRKINQLKPPLIKHMLSNTGEA